jgi:hypothetical protein
MKTTLPLMLTVLCCACASKPYAMIDETRSSRTDASEEDVMVVAVDGRFVAGKATMRVEPGLPIPWCTLPKEAQPSLSSSQK